MIFRDCADLEATFQQSLGIVAQVLFDAHYRSFLGLVDVNNHGRTKPIDFGVLAPFRKAEGVVEDKNARASCRLFEDPKRKRRSATTSRSRALAITYSSHSW